MKRVRVPFLCLLLTLGCAPAPTVSPAVANPTDPERAGDAPAGTKPEPVEAVLGMDPAVTVGKLGNGLTYYIRRHGKPAHRALMWLAVDAGSVLEDPDQRGLAHFVEHMAFNGTERFEKNTLIDFIERAGMDFGADLNAYTSFDETVYMLTVPTDDAEVVSTGLDILEDWAGALSFDPAEVDKERGVVVEEWRLGRGAEQRIFDAQWPVFLKGSKYAERLPIGEREILESAPVSALRRYYDAWYRPDLMAIVIVGDVDPAALVPELERRFGDLAAPADAPARINVPAPILNDVRAAVVTDDEARATRVSLVLKGPMSSLRTESDYRALLVQRLFSGMLGARLEELGEDPASPYAFAFAGQFTMGRAVDVFQLTGFAKPGQAQETARVLAVEYERVRRHGFLSSELERARARMLREYERAAAEEDKTDAGVYARETVAHFLEDEAMPGRARELELARTLLPEIGPEEVNALADRWTASTDRVVMASGPSRDHMPTEAELLAVVADAAKQVVEPYSDAVVDAPLVASLPPAGKITAREELPGIGVSVWTLSNGARLIVKPTEFKNDEVRLSAFSPGGHSLADDAAFPSAESAASIVAQAGWGVFDAAALRKRMAGKVASVTPWIGELEEGVWGSASPVDLELMFQLLHLTFTQPRKDPAAFEAWKGARAAFIQNRDLDPQASFFDALHAFRTRNHLRRQPPSIERLGKIDLDVAYDFYRDRFADAGDFTFVVVGNVDLDRLETLATTYLATLPSTGRKESWRDVGVRYVRGPQRFERRKGVDPKAFVHVSFLGDTKWTPQAQDDLDMLASALDIRLREVLREEMSGVYGAFGGGVIERWPKSRYRYFVGFPCGPERVEALVSAAQAILDEVKTQGVSDDIVSKIREQRRRELETDVEENAFWLEELEEHARHGLDPSELLVRAEASIGRVSSDRIRDTAKRHLGKTRVEGILLPQVP